MSKSLLEAVTVANTVANVTRETIAATVRELCEWYTYSIFRQVLQTKEDKMWTQAKFVSDRARSSFKPGSVSLKRNFSTTTLRGVNMSKRQFSTSSARYNSNASQDTTSPKPLIGDKPQLDPQVPLHQAQVPTSRLARIFHYGQLAAGMTVGAATTGIKQIAQGNASSISMKSLVLSPGNIERMAKKFSKMRGAALKIGQMMSFQDDSVLPKEIQQILLKVQNSAHYMPQRQLQQVMDRDLGLDWRKRLFASFDDMPIAAASIGQVHTAVTEDLTPVVVKIQYPGVADSIDSDLNNLLMFLTASSLLPAGLFLDKTIANARTELKWECDYIREAQNLIRFREIMKDDEVFEVPRVFHQLCGEHVLTMERMRGTEVVHGSWDQATNDWIATNIMRLTLLEIKMKFMQTDPNWANFLYNETTKKIELLDFGAAREFPDEFIDDYVNVLRASVKKDRERVEFYSKKLGYLTGLESPAMVKCHVDSVMVLGEAFSPVDNKGKPFKFSQQTITDRIRGNIGVMLNERLTPPPEETYSLHRKLSGVFLLCARLNATVPCEQLFRDILGFEEE
jgi:aarF domain-containing kinase